MKPKKTAILLLSLVIAIIGIQSCSSKGAVKETQQKSEYKVKSGGIILGSVGASSVIPPGRVRAEGWAASNLTGVAIISVKVLVDGNAVGETKNIGDPPRPDVASGFGVPDFKDSGWKIDIPISNLAPGHHVVAFRAYNSDGNYLDLPGKTLTID